MPAPVHLPSAERPAITDVAPLPYAGFWLRCAALIVDELIMAAPFFVLALGLGVLGAIQQQFTGSDSLVSLLNSRQLDLASNVLGILLGFAYFGYFESQRDGVTPGRKVLGIALHACDGSPISFQRSMLRNLAKALSQLTLGIGYKMQLWTPKRQTLHDKLTDCVVVSVEPVPVWIPWVINSLAIGGLCIALVILIISLMASLMNGQAIAI